MVLMTPKQFILIPFRFQNGNLLSSEIYFYYNKTQIERALAKRNDVARLHRSLDLLPE